MNYQIIVDEQALVEFIDWLPELQDNEKYYMSLFARKKYCPDLIKSNDKTQLKRFVTDKSRMLNKIKQLELPMNTWKLRDQAAPQESLVLYIMPNPRCMKKATEAMGKKCWDLVRSNNFNLHQEAMSCIQISKSRSVYIDFDIDTKEVDLSKIVQVLPENCYNVIETRGGYHVLVDSKRCNFLINYFNEITPDMYNKNWYVKLNEVFNVDQSGDQMIPVPGCVQGGFVPRFIKI